MESARRGRWWSNFRRLVKGGAGFFLFLFALGVMREGSSTFGPLLRDVLAVTNGANSLGFGWLMAYIVQSGSPAAAVAIAMLSAGTLSVAQAFAMIAGSRLGASLIVLQIGLLYALRQKERWASLATGVLSLLLTGSTMVLALPLGLLVLRWGWLDGWRMASLQRVGAGLGGLLDLAVAPLAAVLPGWALFVAGIGLVVLSFTLFDRALPQIRLEGTEFGRIGRLVYRPGVMFLLGLAITFVTMSVSVSVGILVPLSARGYVRRENVMPYILGANISTFVDTLVAALLLGNPAGVTVVLVHMLAGAVVSLLAIALGYRAYERAISAALDWITARRANFVVFVGAMFVLPLLLLLL